MSIQAGQTRRRIFLGTRESALSFARSAGSHAHLMALAEGLGAEVLWSFAGLTGAGVETAEVTELTAMDRPSWPDGTRSLTLLGLLSATTLRGLVLWDLAHTMPVGAVIHLVDYADIHPDNPLLRGYFEGCFKAAVDGSKQVTSLTKIAPLPAEAEAGLDAWSFLIPVGKPNPEALESIADRLNGLGFARIEMMVCCPAEYEDLLPAGWKIVPQPEPRTTLTRKKNLLVDAAQYPNVCVFHDRVIIPRNFRQMVQKFGDFFPITGMQNIYVNAGDFEISRYSDYYFETSLQSEQLRLVATAPDDAPPRYSSGLLYSKYLKVRQGWKSSFVEALPTNYNEQSYLTGSIYTAKKSVWQAVGQNETVDWMQLEDVEFGIVAMRDFGIPSRLNPYGFSRTNRTRPILTELQHAHEPDTLYTTRRRVAGKIGIGTGPEEDPAFPITESEYKERLSGLVARWVPTIYRFEARRAIFELDTRSARSLAYTLIRLLYLCQVQRASREVATFISDFGSSALMSPYDDASLDFITKFVLDGSFLLDEIIKNDYMMKFIYLATRRPLFAREAQTPEEMLVTTAWRKWHDTDSGIVFGGDFKDFVGALQASL